MKKVISDKELDNFVDAIEKALDEAEKEIKTQSPKIKLGIENE